MEKGVIKNNEGIMMKKVFSLFLLLSCGTALGMDMREGGVDSSRKSKGEDKRKLEKLIVNLTGLLEKGSRSTYFGEFSGEDSPRKIVLDRVKDVVREVEQSRDRDLRVDIAAVLASLALVVSLSNHTSFCTLRLCLLQANFEFSYKF
ncbi:MAG: hypothetical protein US13_C0009G0077 [candidate division TM6 bacterium GW2011_GWE2_36_25]|nr:MAG: hypothetical protein US13_C0009G0077 [candidate division TM6 bacterium GW2011_GWE2_36_25]